MQAGLFDSLQSLANLNVAGEPLCCAVVLKQNAKYILGVF